MSTKRAIKSEQAPAPIGPYNQAIMANGFLFISGQIPLKDGELVSDSIEAETHQVMHNLEAILKEAGLGFENVVKTSIFLKNMGDFKTVNEIYGSFFKDTPPARETVEVARLPKDVNIEISCIAVAN